MPTAPPKVIEDDREFGATERGFLLYRYLLKRPRSTAEVKELLGYKGYSGAANLLYRLRAEGLVRDENGFWYVTHGV